jgi:hypothetical protein
MDETLLGSLFAWANHWFDHTRPALTDYCKSRITITTVQPAFLKVDWLLFDISLPVV